MPLTAGEKLGSYEILSPIGAGGMGEVYRARDTKLGREVAIKVLPEEFTQHPEKLARFQREAKLLAALNHPGIATLYGVEESEGKPFLAMELVEGETLAERIARGPVAVDEALPLCQQIAAALEAAHEKGIIHRDLKPANIKVNPEGQVKVLDFGLAKAFAEETPATDSSISPTLSRDSTRAGVILGTAAYMSPEQAKGKEVDKRTDIFSFGIVLYEMLTGRKAFAGEDVSDVLAAVIRAEPDWSALPKALDPRLDALLGRCLRKDRKLRRRDIGDVRVEIQEILAEPVVALSERAKPRANMLWQGIAGVLTITIYVRPFPGPGGKLQISTEGGVEPMWSRDGRELFYRIGGKMMAVAIATEPELAPGSPTLLFEGGDLSVVAGGNPATGYDVAPDGRFVMIRAEESAGGTQQINVVLNWFGELERLGPTNQYDT